MENSSTSLVDESIWCYWPVHMQSRHPYISIFIINMQSSLLIYLLMKFLVVCCIDKRSCYDLLLPILNLIPSQSKPKSIFDQIIRSELLISQMWLAWLYFFRKHQQKKIWGCCKYKLDCFVNLSNIRSMLNVMSILWFFHQCEVN